MEIPPSIEIETVKFVKCKKCEIEMDELEAGYLCPNCDLFIGYCNLCKIYSDNLLAWGLWNDRDSWYKFDENEIKWRNKISKYEFPDILSESFYHAKIICNEDEQEETLELQSVSKTFGHSSPCVFKLI